MAAARAGIDDVEVSYGLGAAGSDLHDELLYAAVREATGGSDAFVAEARIPRASESPPQNWQAADAEALWESPIVGSTGTTVGEAVARALEAGSELPNRLECLGHGIVGALDLPAVPLARDWLSYKACQAYQRGFLENLTSDPRGCVLEVVERGAAPGNL